MLAGGCAERFDSLLSSATICAMAQERTVHGPQLRALRQMAGMYMADLAEKAQCSKGHLRNIETIDDPRHQPSIELIYRLSGALSEALGRPVSLDEFSTENAEQGAA